MMQRRSDDPRRFDSLAIVAGLSTVMAYAVRALGRFTVETVDVNLFSGVLLGSLGAVLSIWVLLRRKNYRPDSSRLAWIVLVLSLPWSCCGWGALNH